ncbi:MAG: two-component regulator propeller domain-containing protein [Candidatus Latescibacterota bacterium]
MKRALLLTLSILILALPQATRAQEILSPVAVRGLALKDNTLWCASAAGVVCMDMQTGVQTRYTVSDGLCDNNTSAIAAFFDGTILAGAACRVFKFNSPSDCWEEVPSGEGLPAEITSILIHPDCMYCVGTEDGVCRYSQDSWGLYTTKNGLADNQVRQLASQPDGTVWFATAGGVTRFHNDVWQSYTTADGLPNNDVTSVAVGNDGAVWAGTSAGIVRLNGSSWTSFTTKDGLPDNRILSLVVAPDKSVWAGTASGIFRFSGVSWSAVGETGAPSGAIRSLAIDSEGRLWAGADDGLFRFDGVSWSSINITPLPTGVESGKSHPAGFLSIGNFPNPFNPGTIIEFTIQETAKTEVSIYNAAGQKINTLVAGTMSAGRHSFVWDGRDEGGLAVASGVYMAVIRTEKARAMHRMLLVR